MTSEVPVNEYGEPEGCLEAGYGDCSGELAWRMPLSGTGASFVRCDYHWEVRLDKQDEIARKYGGDIAPADFDPTYAGERWDDDY